MLVLDASRVFWQNLNLGLFLVRQDRERTCMASGTLGAEEEKPREKHRWSENSKVYTRKFRKGNTNNNKNNNPPIPITTTVTTDNQSNENDNNDNGDKTENNNVPANNSHVGNGTIAVGNEEDNETEKDNDDERDNANENERDDGNERDNDDEIDNETDNAPQKFSPPKEANSVQLQQNLPHIETISEDSYTPNRAEPTVPNGYDGNLANGSVRPVVTQVDDRVSICVSAARSTQEVRDLKRKLEDELDQVRKMARRLEAKEIELNGYCSSEVGVGVGFNSVPPVGNLQFPVNVVLDNGFGFSRRAISDVGSVGFNDSRDRKSVV